MYVVKAFAISERLHDEELSGNIIIYDQEWLFARFK